MGDKGEGRHVLDVLKCLEGALRENEIYLYSEGPATSLPCCARVRGPKCLGRGLRVSSAVSSTMWPAGWEALFTLLATTGMRRSEAMGLWWSDIDLDGHRLSIVRTYLNVGGSLAVCGVTSPTTSVCLEPMPVGSQPGRIRSYSMLLVGVGRDDVACESVDGEVHLGESDGFVDAFLSVDRDPAS